MNAPFPHVQFIPAAPGYFALDFDHTKPEESDVYKMAVIAWAFPPAAGPLPVTLDGVDAVVGAILQPDGTVLDDYQILASVEAWASCKRVAYAAIKPAVTA
ncbi:MAG: hypothetical protein V4723_03105 [Pseudomonadota bacterium]